MENVRKYTIVKLVQKWEGAHGAQALITQPDFQSCSIFDENFVAIQLNKSEITFNKPIYIGLAVLDISKIRLWDFHYSYMKQKFGNNCQNFVYRHRYRDVTLAI